VAAVTLSHAWQLVASMPFAARLALVTLLASAAFGVWPLSKTVATVLVGVAGLVLAFLQRAAARLRRLTTPPPPPAAVSHAQARTVLDVAFDLATEQALAQAETGQGWEMPTREQVAADLGMVRAEHDRVVLSDAEVEAFADLMKRLPMIAAGEPIDPDDARYW
jgi:hypothetical protein